MFKVVELEMLSSFTVRFIILKPLQIILYESMGRKSLRGIEGKLKLRLNLGDNFNYLFNLITFIFMVYRI